MHANIVFFVKHEFLYIKNNRHILSATILSSTGGQSKIFHRSTAEGNHFRAKNNNVFALRNSTLPSSSSVSRNILSLSNELESSLAPRTTVA